MMNTNSNKISKLTIRLITFTSFSLFTIGLVLFILSIYEVIFAYNNNPYKIKYDEFIYYSFGFIFCINKILLNQTHAFAYIMHAITFKFDKIYDLLKHLSFSIDRTNHYQVDIFSNIITVIVGVLYLLNYNTGPFKNIIQIEIIKFILINLTNFLLKNYIYIIYLYIIVSPN